jgi:hypothetical protein
MRPISGRDVARIWECWRRAITKMQTATYIQQSPADHESDGLFAALDQRVIDDGVSRWTAFVLGIYNDGRDRWIQVASGAGTTTKILLRMSRRATAEHAAAALGRALSASECAPPVVDVMRVC